MGCGGSSTYAEDGSVAPGQGEVKVEWNPAKPVEVGFHYYNGKDAKIMTKEFPMDKTCADKVFSTDGCSSSGDMHWAKVVPGNRYSMKYLEDGHSVAFPGQTQSNIPKKIHAFHTKDDAAKDKLVGDLKKDVEKEEGHPYNGEGGDDKAKADIDAIGGLTTCADMSDNMKNFKKAAMTVEDLQPYNTINAELGLNTEYGHWEEKEGKLARQLGMADKVKMKGEEELAKKGPEMTYKGTSKVQEVFKKVIDGAVKGGAKKAGPEVTELSPNLDARLEYMDGCTPGVARAAERKWGEGEGLEEKKEEEGGDEDPVEKEAKAEFAAINIDDLKSNDAKDKKSDVESYLKSVYGSISAADAAADKDKAVVANVQGFQSPAFINDVDGDNVKVSHAANNFQDEAEATIPKQVDGFAEGDKIDAFTSLPAANDSMLARGQSVTFRKGRAFNVGWIKSVDGDTVHIIDQLKVAQKIPKADVYTHITQQQIAARGLAIVPQVAPVKIWWVAAEDPNVTVRKVKVWPFGNDDKAVTVDLKAERGPSKKEGATETVHIGYSAEVEIPIGVKYAYNFQIGEAYFADWEKPVSNDKGCRVFSLQSRVEYA